MKKLVAVFCLMSLSLSAQASQKVLCSVNDNDAVELSWPDGYANFPTEQSIGVFGGRDVRIQLFMGQRHSKGPWEEMIHISAEDGQQGDISKPGHIMASFGSASYVALTFNTGNVLKDGGDVKKNSNLFIVTCEKKK